MEDLNVAGKIREKTLPLLDKLAAVLAYRGLGEARRPAPRHHHLSRRESGKMPTGLALFSPFKSIKRRLCIPSQWAHYCTRSIFPFGSPLVLSEQLLEYGV